MKLEIQELEWEWANPVVQDILLKYYRDRLFLTPHLANAVVEQVLRLAPTAAPAAVLDVGCGLGYHAAAFAKRGLEVFAFDPGDRYIAIGREHAADLGVQIDFCQMYCSGLDEEERFKLAWAGNYCPNQLTSEEVCADFQKIWKALVPGGMFVSSVAGRSKSPPTEKKKNWSEMDDCFVMSEKWSDGTFHHEHCMFLYPEAQRIIKINEVDRMHGPLEIVPQLEAAGFVEIETYNNLKGEEPADAAGSFAFRCKKPEA